MNAWLAHHWHSLAIAARGFLVAPLASLFTVLVIGVAVALPAGLYVLLDNLDRAVGHVKPQAELTVFLKPEVEERAGRALATELGRRPEIANVAFVTKADGVRKLEAAGLADITAGLAENPLPHALVIHPKNTDPAALAALAPRIQARGEVERVVMDADWIKRLSALLGFGQDLVFMLAAMLGLALAAITANTIRLQIYAQKDEIEVARLIGATDRFIRRPFLYMGGIQGLAGGAAGWLIVILGSRIIEGSVARLAAAYGSRFALSGLALPDLAALLALSAALGWLGAYFAVGQALRAVETQ